MASIKHIFKPNVDQIPLAQFVIRQSSDAALNEIRTLALETHLPALTSKSYFTGYEEGGRDQVWNQIHAVYNAVLNMKLRYTLEPTNTYNTPISQTLRGVSEVIDMREATCIDAVNIMAALLLQIGLNPIVIVIGDKSDYSATHAILGVWLEKKLSPHVRMTAADILDGISDIGLCETTGLLQHSSFTFDQAFSGTREFLPEAQKECAPVPPNVAEPDTPLFDVPAHVGILYGVDVRRAMTQYALTLPLIAIMGAKGGVGKTIICARMAELVAETGTNVLLLDFDVENAGSTVFHKERIPYGLPPVQTIYEHLRSRAEGFDPAACRNEQNLGLWDVTPPYLSDNALGRVCLIPARSDHDINAFQVVANIDYRNRNRILSEVVQEIIDRAGLAQDIGCIIVDCGAGTNPLYSAAINRADYGCVVATPEDVCIQQWNMIRSQLRADFPEMDLHHANVLLNRIHNELDVIKWRAHRPIGYVRESSELAESYYRNAVYFDLGYDAFSIDVREALGATLEQRHQHLIPSEFDVWMSPWADILKQGFPSRLLADPRFRRACFVFRALPFVILFCLAVVGTFFSMALTTDWFAEDRGFVTLTSKPELDTLESDLRSKVSYSERDGRLEIRQALASPEIESLMKVIQSSEDESALRQRLLDVSAESQLEIEITLRMTLVRLGLLVACLLCLVAFGGSLYYWTLSSRRKTLLRELAALDPNDKKSVYEYLRPILRPVPPPGTTEHISARKPRFGWLKPDRLAMEWLGALLDTEIKESRDRVLEERLSTRTETHV